MYTARYWQGLVFFDKMRLELSVLFDLLRNNHIEQTGNHLSLTTEGLKLQQSTQSPEVGKEYILVHSHFVTRAVVNNVDGDEISFTSKDGSDKIWIPYCFFIDPNKVK